MNANLFNRRTHYWATILVALPVLVIIASGIVLQSAFRRSDTIEALHDGSFFGGEIGRRGLFLPPAAATTSGAAGGLTP